MEEYDFISDSWSGEIIILLIVERISTKIIDYLKHRDERKEALRLKRWNDSGL